VHPQFFVSDWGKYFFFLDVDVDSVMILKRGTEPPQPDFLLVSPLDYCGLSLHIFVMDEEVRGLLELAYCAGENGLAFG